MVKSDKKLIPPGLTYLADNITAKDNILGADRASRAEWARELDLPAAMETIFFAGCGYQYASELETLMSMIRRIDESALSTELTMSLAGLQKKLGLNAAGILRRFKGKKGDDPAQPLKDAVRVLRHLGLDFGYLAEEEPCCGGLLYYTGLHQDFARQAQAVQERFRDKGVRRVIGLVPSCTYTLHTLVPGAAGGDLEVSHFCQVVAERVPGMDLRFPRKVRVTYHDPCQLVRYLGLVEEPRRILRAIKGIELVEAEGTGGEWATCCGGGGGFEAVFPELSHMLAVNRARELADTGAEIIVTHCPGCIMQLKAGLKALKADKPVLDLTQIIAAAMGSE